MVKYEALGLIDNNLKSFLLSQNVLDLYIENHISALKVTKVVKLNNFLFAFPWVKTKQGLEFWSKLHSQWMAYKKGK